ncbi:MAG: DMT family transporter [Actinobacteria bacterium]|nr:DMT family transporter [Actinomycetota bacterium]
MAWPYLLFAFAAGVALPVQFGINAQLAVWLHSPIRAAFISFLTGAVILAVAAALVFKPLPSWNRLGHAPWWVWLGGALGAFYVAGSIFAAPKLGAAALIAVIVAGQSLASLAVDHFGWVGFEQKHISPGRIVGMALVGAGVALVRIF